MLHLIPLRIVFMKFSRKAMQWMLFSTYLALKLVFFNFQHKFCLEFASDTIDNSDQICLKRWLIFVTTVPKISNGNFVSCLGDKSRLDDNSAISVPTQLCYQFFWKRANSRKCTVENANSERALWKVAWCAEHLDLWRLNISVHLSTLHEAKYGQYVLLWNDRDRKTAVLFCHSF